MTPPNLAHAYAVRRIQARNMPEPIADPPETISERTVGLLVVGMVWTFILIIYVMG